MDYRKAVVKDGNLIEVVNVIDDEIQYYELQDGEFLVDDLSFQGMLRPKWLDNKWIETATKEEIDQANYIPLQPKTDIEILQEENKLLKAQVQANADISDFHEELIVELAMMVY